MGRGETSGDQSVFLGVGGDEAKARRGAQGPALPLLHLGFSQMEVTGGAECSILDSYTSRPCGASGLSQPLWPLMGGVGDGPGPGCASSRKTQLSVIVQHGSHLGLGR